MSTFIPPFCPNRSCEYHNPDSRTVYVSYISWGSYTTKAFGEVPRFRCICCGRTYSSQTFSVDYYVKKVRDYEDLVGRLVSTAGLRAMGRSLKLSSDSVSNRIARAARQALALESRLSRTRTLSENLAADGFESFCVSQYFPNNINVLVGSRSQFVYMANHITIRRKGRMTKRQKARRDEIEKHWCAEPRGIEKAFSELVDESLYVLSDLPLPSLVLWTDEKAEYPRGISRSICASFLRSEGRLVHKTISSKAARTVNNPLFSVNYLDRELRKDLHEHVRESVCFGRNVNRQMERLALYVFYHNYRKAYRIKGEQRSHAEIAGYDGEQIKKELLTIWKERAMLSRTVVSASMRYTWLRKRPTPLRDDRDYLPAYAA